MLRFKRVLLKTALNPGSGYGRDGILLTRELDRAGADLHLEPKYVGLPLPEDVVPFFCKERADHFELAINHEYPGELEFPPSMHLHADKTVAWTMYEFNSFGENNSMAENLAARLANFDVVLAYDDVSRQALAEYMPEEDHHRLRILQGGYDADFWVPTPEQLEQREWDGPFRFCMNGTMNARKNPWAALNAFKALKDEHGDAFNAELHMKTTTMSLPPVLEQWCPGLRIHYEHWSLAQIKAFYLSMNCILAPSWGEGKNLPALEAQTTGIPAIVSAVGGHLQWADSSFTYLVRGPIEEHQPGMGSMRVSEEDLAEKMWYVYSNRGEAEMKGELAARLIPQMCDWQPVVRRLETIVEEIPTRNYA